MIQTPGLSSVDDLSIAAPLESVPAWLLKKWKDFMHHDNKSYTLTKFESKESGKVRFTLNTDNQARVIAAHKEKWPSTNWKDYKTFADDYVLEKTDGVSAGVKPLGADAWTTEHKNNYRKSLEWIRFRDKEIEKRRLKNRIAWRCDYCGKVVGYPLDCHHLLPRLYNLLQSRLFKCLCRECHAKETKKGL